MELKPGYKQTEVGVIPEDWEVCNLADLSLKITDGDHLTPKRESSGYYLLSARNVLNGRIDVRDVDYVGLAEYQRMKQRCGPGAGDILISCSGTIGRVAVVPQGFECVLVRSAALAKINKSLADGAFLKFWLQGENAQSQISASVNQGAQPNLFLNQIERLKCPKPPLSEQLSIANVLDDLDELLSELDQLIAKKRDIKQAAMQDLLTGKRRLPGFEGEWEVKRLGDICNKIQDGTHFSPALGGGDYLYVTSKNIRRGFMDLRDVDRISAAEHEKIYRRCDARRGDLLLTKDGANTGNAALVNIDQEFSLLSSVAMLRFDVRRHNAAYFMYQILSAAGQAQIQEAMSGNAITRLTLAKIRDLQFQTPGVSEQVAISEMLLAIDQEISVATSKRTKASLLKQAMLQELLTGRIRLV